MTRRRRCRRRNPGRWWANFLHTAIDAARTGGERCHFSNRCVLKPTTGCNATNPKQCNTTQTDHKTKPLGGPKKENKPGELVRKHEPWHAHFRKPTKYDQEKRPEKVFFLGPKVWKISLSKHAGNEASGWGQNRSTAKSGKGRFLKQPWQTFMCQFWNTDHLNTTPSTWAFSLSKWNTNYKHLVEYPKQLKWSVFRKWKTFMVLIRIGQQAEFELCVQQVFPTWETHIVSQHTENRWCIVIHKWHYRPGHRRPGSHYQHKNADRMGEHKNPEKKWKDLSHSAAKSLFYNFPDIRNWLIFELHNNNSSWSFRKLIRSGEITMFMLGGTWTNTSDIQIKCVQKNGIFVVQKK